MRHSPLRLTAAAAAAITASVGLGATAFAATSTTSPSTKTAHHHAAALPANATLAQIQAAAASAVSQRVTDLGTAVTKVQQDKDLGADQAALLKPLQADIPALQQLGQKIAADTTAATAKADYGTIFSNYRVYLVALPVTRMVAVDDRITNKAAPRLTNISARIASRETAANAGAVKPLLSDAASETGAGTAAIKGQVAQLEAVTPASWNANHSVLASYRTASKTAVADLRKAATDERQAAGDVGLARHSTSTTPSTPSSSSSSTT